MAPSWSCFAKEFAVGALAFTIDLLRRRTKAVEDVFDECECYFSLARVHGSSASIFQRRVLRFDRDRCADEFIVDRRPSPLVVSIEYNKTAPPDTWRADRTKVPAAEGSRGALAEPRARHPVTNAEGAMASEKTGHEHSAEEERQIREASLDETIADSFPASDPASSDPNPDDHSALERARPPVADRKRRSP